MTSSIEAIFFDVGGTLRATIKGEGNSLEYLRNLGLFEGQNFLDLKMIIADVHVSYLAPIELGQQVRVGTRTAKIGNKSITFEYRIEDSGSGQLLATGEVVGVTYDYRAHATIPVPPDWRAKIGAFEGVDFKIIM